LCTWAFVCGPFGHQELRAEDSPETRRDLQELKQENRLLHEQLKKQAALIEALTHKVNGLEETDHQRSRNSDSLKDGQSAGASAVAATLGKVSLSAEGALAFF